MMNSDDFSMEEELDILESNFTPWLKEKVRLISSLLKGKKILEVGCGTGNLVQFLSDKNLEIMGTDYSNVYLEKARKKNPNVEFFKADLLHKEEWNSFKNSFDSVIASEVIEHIEDDLAALKTINSLLKPDGILVLTVPAFDSLYSPLDKKIGHYRRYSKKSICAKIQKAGFKIGKTRYWNLLGLVGWLLTFKILKKDFKTTKKPSVGFILGKWLKIESIIPMPIGLTIFVQAIKTEKKGNANKK